MPALFKTHSVGTDACMCVDPDHSTIPFLLDACLCLGYNFLTFRALGNLHASGHVIWKQASAATVFLPDAWHSLSSFRLRQDTTLWLV
jgi:hypothetical protein